MHNMKGMVTKEKVLEVAKKLFPCDLPIGVYLVMKDGEFVRCNRRAREILGLLENEVEVNVNINDFYSNPDERNRLMKELEEAEANGRFLEKKVVIFNVRGQTIWVQDYCRSIKDPATGSIIGYSGCLVDVTEEESFRQLFEKLPVGVYKLNAQDIIVRVNKAYAGILGYEDPSELEGKNIKELYVEPSEADRLDRLIAEQESVVNEKVELFKKNEERCYVSVCAYKKTDTDGRTYIGVEGTIQDVTEEETYRQIRDMLPVGTYLIRKNEEGKEVFEQCNKAFARMFEYEIDELKGKEVRELYASEKDYQNFIAELAEKQEQEDTPEDIPIKAKTSTGKIMTLEVHSRVLVDGAGSIIGRVGLVLDISNEVALWELRDDIGKTLHFYSAALVTLEQSIKPVLKAIGPDPFERDTLLTVENAIKTLSKPADNLKDAIIRLIDMGKTSPGRQSAISEKDWSTLKDLKDSLENFQDISPYPEFQMPTLYEISNKVLDFSNKIEKGKLPRELIKNVSIQAKELQRIYCLIRTHQALDTIIEADYSARALREYVIFQ
ncbi:MAG: PAS domain-containing protein, partial [Candidatus Aminicenantes bacterium]|nr:PAS domain-containing protein [Candidatus Aminicenantes bacterium]